MPFRVKVKKIMALLEEEYGTEVPVSLEYGRDKGYELLIATILSAQCTDARVNQVTRELFRKYKSLEDFARADLAELEEDIHSCGFYHSKAMHIIQCADRLIKEYGGKLPSDIEELTSLAGVGRKTANVVRTHIFHIPSIVVDTHVKRIARRLDLTDETEPEKVESDLMEKLPKKQWSPLNLQLITLGRTICTSRSPRCGRCFLAGECRWYNTQEKERKRGR